MHICTVCLANLDFFDTHEAKVGGWSQVLGPWMSGKEKTQFLISNFVCPQESFFDNLYDISWHFQYDYISHNDHLEFFPQPDRL